MSELIKEISIREIEGVSIGNAQDYEAKTGVTVIYFEKGAQTGCDISGGGPASRETPLTSSQTADNPLNAIVLSGGSAFGLAASDGVMSCLEDRGIGFDTGFSKVPLVCQSCIFDLGYGKSNLRPTAKMGYEACERALTFCDDSTGNIGAGTGAAAGKLMGMAQGTKTGLGIHAVQMGQLKLAAIVALNPLGDVYDSLKGCKIAGLMDSKRKAFLDTQEVLLKMSATPTSLFHTNTTIGCVICNAGFNKAHLKKIASMTRNAYSRCINPVGTLADGDSIYACSVGEVKADLNAVGTLAARVMEKAIKSAVFSSKIGDDEYLSSCIDMAK